MAASPLLINEPPLQVLPSLARKIGLNEAIIVQQIHYWLNREFKKKHYEGRNWIHNTYDQWQEQFPFWGEKTIRRTIANLEDSQILISFVTRDFKKTKFYTINYDRLQQMKESSEMAENLGSHPSGQNDQIDVPKRADRGGQYDQIDQVKVTRSYNKDTETTLTENTPLLIPPVSEFPKEEEEELKKMLVIWNEFIQAKLHPGKEVYPTPKRFAAFKTFLTEVFQGDQSGWKAYCEKIAQCKFLMGQNTSGFKVTLDWALVPDNAYKILEGAIYDKPTPEPVPVSESSSTNLLEDLYKQVEEGPLKAPWIQIATHLINKIGSNAYKSWFSKATLVEVEHETMTIGIETAFARNYITSHLSQDLEYAIKSAFPSIKYIQFQVNANKGPSLC
jgi:hypothetical protein